MTDEQDPPVEQPQEPQTPPQESPVPEPSPPPQEPPKEPTSPPAQQQTDWRDRRIAQLTRQLHELRGRQQEPQPGQQPQPSQDEISRQIEERATAIAAANEFTRRCNEAAEAGRQVFPDFDQRVAQLKKTVDANDGQQVQAYNTFLSAALETGQAPQIIHQLAGDLNEAGRILSLSPVKMAVELAKMALKPAPQQSQAPRPINPVGTAPSNRSPILPDDPDRADGLSIDDWMRRRDEQVRERVRGIR